MSVQIKKRQPFWTYSKVKSKPCVYCGKNFAIASAAQKQCLDCEERRRSELTKYYKRQYYYRVCKKKNPNKKINKRISDVNDITASTMLKNPEIITVIEDYHYQPIINGLNKYFKKL